MIMRSFLSQSSAKGARSTALHSLQWALGLLLASLPTLAWAKAQDWLFVLIIGMIVFVLLVFLGAYIYLLLRNPDALRSEEFSLSKMAMEKGLVGDNISGLYDSRVSRSNVDATVHIGSDQGAKK
jgi:hypothetical protein